MTPSESDYLLRLASLALSFVGFSSVVVSLRGALGGDIADRHLRLVRIYIEGGFLVTALALVPTALNFVHVPAAVIWPVSSGIGAFFLSLVLIVQFRRRRSIEPGPFPLWVIAIYIGSVAMVTALWLNVVPILYPSGAGPYAVALTWALCVFGFIFVRTMGIVLHRAPDDPA